MEVYAKFAKAKKEFKGRFVIVADGKVICEAVARSGQPNYQDSYWITAKSPIPPGSDIEGSYEINLTAHKVDSAAMGEWFYEILPDPIKQKNGGGIRRLIGLHEDANYDTAPGTAGCIGISPSHWNKVDEILFAFWRKGISKIPLIVVYY